MAIEEDDGFGGSTEASQSKLYRGGSLVACPVPLNLTMTKALWLGLNDPIERGFIDGYTKKNVPSKIENGEPVIRNGKVGFEFNQATNIPLDKMINMVKRDQLPGRSMYEEFDLNRCWSTGQDQVGILPIGRRAKTPYPTMDRFKKDLANGKFPETYKKFIELVLAKDPGEWNAFSEAASLCGTEYHMPSDLTIPSSPDEIKRSMKIFAAYLHGRLQTLNPTPDSMRGQLTKFLDLECLGDLSNTRFFRDEKDGNNWKAQGFFYILRRGDTIQLYYADPFSTEGSEICFILTEHTKDGLVKALQSESVYDQRGEPLRRNVGTGRLEDYVSEETRQLPGGERRILTVNLRRNANSPITHVPVMNLSRTTKQGFGIYVGDTSGDRRENSLIVTN